MIKTVIIDDELNAREFLEKLLMRYFPDKFFVCTKCQSVDEGIVAIQEHEPDLVFLDIQMPEKNGFELFKAFQTVNFQVVFTTAFKDFAIKAIRYSAFDYLLKPINYIDLLSTVKRYENKLLQNAKQQRLELLLENLGNNGNSFNKLALPTETGLNLIEKSNILYAKADDNYCVIKLVDGKTITISKTLKHIEELIDSNIFLRIHKSYLVNLNYVKQFFKIEMEVELLTNERLPISHRKKDTFVKAITTKQ